MTSHHLVSPTKRRSMQSWAHALGLNGFAKVGYPGVVYVQGRRRGDVEEFVRRVRGMQWFALRVRFVERVEPVVAAAADGGGGGGAEVDGKGGERGRWVEVEKVGEVVEEMRRMGRERYVLEMGIGSVGVGAGAGAGAGASSSGRRADAGNLTK